MSHLKIENTEKTTGQHDVALLVCCMDCRLNNVVAVDDIYVQRNAGNVVAEFGDDVAMSAGVHLLVNKKGSKHVAVMGHSDCAAMGHVCSGEHDTYLDACLKNGAQCDEAITSDELAKHNVLLGIKRLQEEYPMIPEGVNFHALYHDLEKGQTLAYNRVTHQFDIELAEGISMAVLDELAEEQDLALADTA